MNSIGTQVCASSVHLCKTCCDMSVVDRLPLMVAARVRVTLLLLVEDGHQQHDCMLQCCLLFRPTDALTGTIPADLCQNSKLSILSLRSNSFTGVPHQLLNCTDLTQLDISSNNFSGTLPDSPNGWNWTRLVSLDASYNDFEGSIPDAVYGLSVLGYLNLGNNRWVCSTAAHASTAHMPLQEGLMLLCLSCTQLLTSTC